MKQRLLVMNGQRLVQIEREKQWSTEKIEKAAGVKPGIYNLYLAIPADTACAHVGVIVHLDQDCLYQQTSRGIVRHRLADFAKAPEVGVEARIEYSMGMANPVRLEQSRRQKHRL